MVTFARTAAMVLAGTVATMAAAPAFAATTVNVTQLSDGTYGAGFASMISAAGSGSLTFDLVFPVAGTGSVTFNSTLSKLSGVAITGATLGGTALTLITTSLGTSSLYNGGAEIDLASSATLPLVISYVAKSSGLVGGNITFAASAVPEPAAWALMIGGFAVVGGFMRRRPNRVVKTNFAFA